MGKIDAYIILVGSLSLRVIELAFLVLAYPQIVDGDRLQIECS
jgi:hypothetical protein